MILCSTRRWFCRSAALSFHLAGHAHRRATALVLRAMREAPAAKRYLVACVSLALMLLARLQPLLPTAQ